MTPHHNSHDHHGDGDDWPRIVEFEDVRRDPHTGMWSATHIRSRRFIEATTLDGLEQRACAVRIAESWRTSPNYLRDSSQAEQPRSALRDLTDDVQARAHLRETAERARQVLHLISRRWRDQPN